MEDPKTLWLVKDETKNTSFSGKIVLSDGNITMSDTKALINGCNYIIMQVY